MESEETTDARLEALEEAMTTDRHTLKTILTQVNSLNDLLVNQPTETKSQQAPRSQAEEEIARNQPVAVSFRRYGQISAPMKGHTSLPGDASSCIQSLISNEELHHTLSRLAVAMGPGQRTAIVEQVAVEFLLTSTQLASLLSHLRLASEREAAARRLALCLVDSENCADALLPVFARLPRQELQRVLQSVMAYS